MSKPLYTKLYIFDRLRNKIIVHLVREFIDPTCPQFTSLIRKWGKWTKINPNMTINFLLRWRYYLTKAEALKNARVSIKTELKINEKIEKSSYSDYLKQLSKTRKKISVLKKKLEQLSA